MIYKKKTLFNLMKLDKNLLKTKSKFIKRQPKKINNFYYSNTRKWTYFRKLRSYFFIKQRNWKILRHKRKFFKPRRIQKIHSNKLINKNKKNRYVWIVRWQAYNLVKQNYINIKRNFYRYLIRWHFLKKQANLSIQEKKTLKKYYKLFLRSFLYKKSKKWDIWSTKHKVQRYLYKKKQLLKYKLVPYHLNKHTYNYLSLRKEIEESKKNLFRFKKWPWHQNKKKNEKLDLRIWKNKINAKNKKKIIKKKSIFLPEKHLKRGQKTIINGKLIKQYLILQHWQHLFTNSIYRETKKRLYKPLLRKRFIFFFGKKYAVKNTIKHKLTPKYILKNLREYKGLLKKKRFYKNWKTFVHKRSTKKKKIKLRKKLKNLQSIRKKTKKPKALKWIGSEFLYSRINQLAKIGIRHYKKYLSEKWIRNSLKVYQKLKLKKEKYLATYKEPISIFNSNSKQILNNIRLIKNNRFYLNTYNKQQFIQKLKRWEKIKLNFLKKNKWDRNFGYFIPYQSRQSQNKISHENRGRFHWKLTAKQFDFIKKQKGKKYLSRKGIFFFWKSNQKALFSRMSRNACKLKQNLTSKSFLANIFKITQMKRHCYLCILKKNKHLRKNCLNKFCSRYGNCSKLREKRIALIKRNKKRRNNFISIRKYLTKKMTPFLEFCPNPRCRREKRCLSQIKTKLFHYKIDGPEDIYKTKNYWTFTKIFKRTAFRFFFVQKEWKKPRFKQGKTKIFYQWNKSIQPYTDWEFTLKYSSRLYKRMNFFWKHYSTYYDLKSAHHFRKLYKQIQTQYKYTHSRLSNLIWYLESRLVWATMRCGLAWNISLARFLVNRGYISINGKQNYNSIAHVKTFDILQIAPHSKQGWILFWQMRNLFHRALFDSPLLKFRNVYKPENPKYTYGFYLDQPELKYYALGSDSLQSDFFEEGTRALLY